VITKKSGKEAELLAEDCFLLAFTGTPQSAEWLSSEAAEELLSIVPDGNVLPDQARDTLSRVIAEIPLLGPNLEQAARERAEALLGSHVRVREALRAKGVSYRVEPQLPVDVLGTYVYLPKPS
jgi:hypothetical protein